MTLRGGAEGHGGSGLVWWMTSPRLQTANVSTMGIGIRIVEIYRASLETTVNLQHKLSVAQRRCFVSKCGYKSEISTPTSGGVF